VERRERNSGLGFCSLPIHGLTQSSAAQEGPPCIDSESSWIIHQVKSSHHPKHMPRINVITSVGDQQVWRQRAALVIIQSHEPSAMQSSTALPGLESIRPSKGRVTGHRRWVGWDLDICPLQLLLGRAFSGPLGRPDLLLTP